MGDETTRYHDGANLLANVEMHTMTGLEEEPVRSSHASGVTLTTVSDGSLETKEVDQEHPPEARQTSISTPEARKQWAQIDLDKGA